MTFGLIVLAAIVSLAIAAFSATVFILGVRFGAREATRHKPQVEVVKVPEPFVVKEQVVKEVTTPGFVYAPPGTPSPSRDAADKKMAELIGDPEI